MRKSLLILSSFVIALSGCVNEEELTYDETWNEDFDYTVDDDTITVPSEITDTIDLRLFDVINLDYPGLEKVKQAYESRLAYEQDETTGDSSGYYLAAAYLLEYYRNLTEDRYPQIAADLVNATYTDNEKTIADRALEGHFYVRNFTLPVGSETYEDFADFGMTTAEDGTVTINWGMAMPSDLFPDGSEQEWNSQQHRHQWMISEALVYRATGDEDYIENWKTVYRNWVDNSPAPEGAETSNTVTGSDIRWYGLQPSERLIDQCAIFYYFLDSENMTPGYFSFFLSEFAKTANIIMSNPYGPVSEGHNITLTQNQALFYACAMFPEFKNAGDWETYSGANLQTLNENVFLNDGGPVERDLHYHIGNVSNFYNITLVANANNKTLPGNFVTNLEGACNFTVDMTYPNYSVDNFNDTRSSSWTESVLRRNFGDYYEMFPDNNKFRYMYTRRSDGSEPDELVSVYQETGYYMLRTGWTEDASMVILKNNPEGEWHCQYDNLTFSIYSNGINFSPDAGCYTYDNGSNRDTYAGADYHNTMVKPDASDRICRGQAFDETTRTGEYLGHYSGNNYDVIVAQNRNYSDLTHRRAIFKVSNRFYVVVDEGYGDYSGLVKLLLKGGNPQLNDESNASNFIIENSTRENYESSFDPSLPVTMHTDLPVSSNMMFVTFPETTDGYDSNWTTNYFCNQLITDNSQRIQRRIYEIKQTKPADGAVRFITVLYPYGAASEYENIDITASFTDSGFSESGTRVRVTVDNNGSQETYNLSYTINQ